MPESGKPLTGILTAAVFIVLEIAALCLLSATSSLQNIWINRISHRVMAATWGSGEKITNYFLLEKQNETLARENYQLLMELQKCRAENDRFKAMAVLDTTELPQPFHYIPATIKKMSRNAQHNYIIIDKGSEEGIKPHSGIVTGKGVIGIISAVDKHYSYGMTLMNSKISVSSRVKGSDICAVLEWNGKGTDKAILRKVPLHQDVEPGDTIETSGYSNLFPSGIPLGICGETSLLDGAEKVVDVTLFEDFSALKYVIIAENPDIDVLQTMEKL